MAAKLVYAAMASGAYYAGTVSMGVRLIAKNCALSKTTVMAAIEELCKTGFIEKWDGEKGKRQKYLLLSPVFSRRQGKENIVVVDKGGNKRLASVDRREVG